MIEFGSGISPSAVTAERSWNNLILRKVFCGFSPFPRSDAEYDDDAPAVLLHNGAVGPNAEQGKSFRPLWCGGGQGVMYSDEDGIV